MTLPSEAELIEMENRTATLIGRSEKALRVDPHGEWADRFDQLRADFRLLISLARDPTILLRSIPDDKYLDLYDDARVRRAIAPVTPQKARPAKKKRKKS